MENFKLMLLILVCFGLSACSSSSNNQEQQIHTGSNILKTFGDEDLMRMQEFVDRFNDKNGDYVLAIPPIIDGGYTIYDLKSDGNLLTIRMDSTRDIYGGKESTFTCGAMKIQDEGDKQHLVLGKCEGLEEDAAAEVIFFTFNSGLTQ
ncbi:MAG: hypothetical protein WD469_11880 [Paenibacillaceae bacterium]